MGRSSSYYEGSNSGKVVLSKCAVAVWVILTVLVIVAVGLLAGLLGKSSTSSGDNQPSVSTSTPATPTTATNPGVVTTEAPSDCARKWDQYRLPETLEPFHYVVDLQPVLTPVGDDFYTFNGTSSVMFNVKTATRFVVIHSNKLNYTMAEVYDSMSNSVPQAGRYCKNEDKQFLILEMSEDLAAGENYELKTAFEGELAEDLGGLYRSSYEDSNGQKKVIATTQMQPTDARKAFPCFDEPALKATFDISLWHAPPNYALSNMPNISTEHMYGDWMKTTFNTTAKMSTYLLAFVVCDFSFTENFTLPDVQTRIYARPQQIEEGNGDYARDITPSIITHFENFFEVEYPLPKSDQIAVPDFAAGAMENWGLVIYRETALLYNPSINSASNKQRVAVVVAHELAHQWFGNLISPTWWDELWLNEGFASYVEYIGTNAVEGSWQMHDQFVVVDLQHAMGVDALTTSRPIVPGVVQSPDDINALFDTISYSKGACIIRMINEFAGDKSFKLGLKNYLDANAYGSVDHNQLFESWNQAMNQTNKTELPPSGFSGSMSTWILQMGYPVIHMKRIGSTSDVVITQERFLLDPKANKSSPASPFDYNWDVPLWYITRDQTEKNIMWTKRNEQSQITVPTDQYFIGNYEAFGYYRVNYDDENWVRITNQLNSNYEAINVKSRGQLIHDAFSLARAGHVSYDIALGLTKFLRQDFEYVPWESALDVLSYLGIVLGRSYVYGDYEAYLKDLVLPLYMNVTWVDDDSSSHLQQYQRINAIETACAYGHQDCIQEATKQFAEWKNKTRSITPNLRTPVYCNGIRYGGVEEWDYVWERYQNETNSQEKSKLQYALTCTKEFWIIQRFLSQMVLNSSLVRSQDAASIIQNLCGNEYARDITWDFIRSEWDLIHEIYGTGFFSFSGIISSCTSHFSTTLELNELNVFIEENKGKLGTALLTAHQAVEKTNTNIDWRQDHQDVISHWLSVNLPL